jgi:hypothetical protein
VTIHETCLKIVSGVCVESNWRVRAVNDDAAHTFFRMVRQANGRPWTNRTIFSLRLNDPTDWSSSVTFSNPFRRVCLTLQSANNAQAKTTRCWNIMYRIAPVLASCIYDRTQPRKPCKRDIFPKDPAQNPEVKVAVGQTLVTNVYFELLSPGYALVPFLFDNIYVHMYMCGREVTSVTVR